MWESFEIFLHITYTYTSVHLYDKLVGISYYAFDSICGTSAFLVTFEIQCLLKAHNNLKYDVQIKLYKNWLL